MYLNLPLQTLLLILLGFNELLRAKGGKAMVEPMGFEEMLKKFNGEWLLVEYEELDEQLRVKSGRVLFHSPDKNKVYEHLMEIHDGGCIAIEYAGEAPRELIVLF